MGGDVRARLLISMQLLQYVFLEETVVWTLPGLRD